MRPIRLAVKGFSKTATASGDLSSADRQTGPPSSAGSRRLADQCDDGPRPSMAAAAREQIRHYRALCTPAHVDERTGRPAGLTPEEACSSRSGCVVVSALIVPLGQTKAPTRQGRGFGSCVTYEQTAYAQTSTGTALSRLLITAPQAVPAPFGWLLAAMAILL